MVFASKRVSNYGPQTASSVSAASRAALKANNGLATYNNKPTKCCVCMLLFVKSQGTASILRVPSSCHQHQSKYFITLY